jgi:hypothetical protein
MTRHRAAQILVLLFGAGFLLVVASGLISGTRSGELSDTYTEILLATTSLIVGAVGGYLSRRMDDGDREDDIKSQVGYVLAAVLGAMTLMWGLTLFVSSLGFVGDQELSANSTNVLSVLVGGTIGALGAYLGLNPQHHPFVPSFEEPLDKNSQQKTTEKEKEEGSEE